MSSTSLESLPIEVGQLGNFQFRMTRNLGAAIEDWDEVCAALGSWEKQHLTGSELGSVLRQHRAWVDQLLEWGEVLRRVTEHTGFSDRELADRVNARLGHLRDKLALWHREMTQERAEDILRAAFE